MRLSAIAIVAVSVLAVIWAYNKFSGKSIATLGTGA